MAQLEVPIISTVIGEGGSGGALAISVADQLLMLQYAVYSVISPEGCASILWKTGERAADAAEAAQDEVVTDVVQHAVDAALLEAAMQPALHDDRCQQRRRVEGRADAGEDEDDGEC